MASLSQLRTLAEHLSPGLKVAESELAPVVSALIQVVQHGDPLITAAEQGAQAVADFYHELISKDAAARGLPAPPKGAPVQSAPAQPVTPVPAGAAGTPVTLEQVAALIQQAIAGAAAGTVTVSTGLPSDTTNASTAVPADPTAPADPSALL